MFSLIWARCNVVVYGIFQTYIFFLPQNAGVQSRAVSLQSAAASADNLQHCVDIAGTVTRQQQDSPASSADVTLSESASSPSTSSCSQVFPVPSIKEEIVDGDDMMGDFGHAVFLGPEDGAGGGGLEEDGLAETEDEEEMGETDALEDIAAVASVKEELVLEGEDHG